jgi:hypothetical protein
VFALFHAGLVAAGRQIAAVMLLTLFLSWVPSSDFNLGSLICGGTEMGGVSVLIAAYLIVAAGLAMTGTKAVDLTAASICRAASRMRLARPEHALKTLIFQLGVPAIAFAALAFRAPPEVMSEIARNLGCDSAANAIWGATMSIGLACFGATANAAFKALKL